MKHKQMTAKRLQLKQQKQAHLMMILQTTLLRVHLTVRLTAHLLRRAAAQAITQAALSSATQAELKARSALVQALSDNLRTSLAADALSLISTTVFLTAHHSFAGLTLLQVSTLDLSAEQRLIL